MVQGTLFLGDIRRPRSWSKSVRERDFDPWLLAAEQSDVPELQRFAAGLRRDYAAVNAALTLPWSNGQVEGQVNRLKLLKRQMYGRAGFELSTRYPFCESGV
jgi:transposase